MPSPRVLNRITRQVALFSQLIPKHLELSLDRWIDESFKFLLSPKLREEPAYDKSHRKRALVAWVRLWRKLMSGVNICLSLQSVMSPNSDYRQKVDFNPESEEQADKTLD